MSFVKKYGVWIVVIAVVYFLFFKKDSAAPVATVPASA
jgi:hypothetical protein